MYNGVYFLSLYAIEAPRIVSDLAFQGASTAHTVALPACLSVSNLSPAYPNTTATTISRGKSYCCCCETTAIMRVCNDDGRNRPTTARPLQEVTPPLSISPSTLFQRPRNETGLSYSAANTCHLGGLPSHYVLLAECFVS